MENDLGTKRSRLLSRIEEEEDKIAQRVYSNEDTRNDLAWKIKHLRATQCMTLEQVALRVGVGKSTVRKWETGMIANMGRDKIALLATALGTTPAYLMGWEEKSKPKPSPEEPELYEGEKELLELFRQIPYEAQKMYLEVLRASLKNQSKD